MRASSGSRTPSSVGSQDSSRAATQSSIHQLLNHTSGLADFEYDPTVLAPYLAGDLSHAWAPRKLVQIAVSHPPLFAPGTEDCLKTADRHSRFHKEFDTPAYERAR